MVQHPTNQVAVGPRTFKSVQIELKVSMKHSSSLKLIRQNGTGPIGSSAVLSKQVETNVH
jgi:hypothetical protein